MHQSVTQEHGMGCGVACVAYVLNISYQEALKLFAEPTNAWNKGFWCKDLIATLQNGGRPYKFLGYKPSLEEALYTPNTIVFVAPSSQYPAGHYLVRAQDDWMNPWINFPVICPTLSGFQAELPGNPEYIIIPKL